MGKKVTKPKVSSTKTNYQPPKQVLEEHQEFMTKLGGKLKELRIGRNLSVNALVKEIGISRSSYHLMEHGKIYFNLGTLLQVLKCHGISATDFFKDL